MINIIIKYIIALLWTLSYLDRDFYEVSSVVILKELLLRVSSAALVWFIVIFVSVTATTAITPGSTTSLVQHCTGLEECRLYYENTYDSYRGIDTEIS